MSAPVVPQGHSNAEPVDKLMCPGFDCGDEQINQVIFEQLTSGMNEANVRVHTTVDTPGRVSGLVALSFYDFLLESDDRDRAAAIRHPVTTPNASSVQINTLAVHKDHQGVGLGRYLLDYSVDIALRAGHLIGVRYVSVFSTPSAKAFYEKNFFDIASKQDSSGLTLMVLDLKAF